MTAIEPVIERTISTPITIPTKIGTAAQLRTTVSRSRLHQVLFFDNVFFCLFLLCDVVANRLGQILACYAAGPPCKLKGFFGFASPVK